MKGENETWLIDSFTVCNFVLCCIIIVSFSNILHVTCRIYPGTFVNPCLWDNNTLKYYCHMLMCRDPHFRQGGWTFSGFGSGWPLLFFPSTSTEYNFNHTKSESKHNKVGKQHYLILCFILQHVSLDKYGVLFKQGKGLTHLLLG